MVVLLLRIHQRINLAHGLVDFQSHSNRIRNLRSVLDAHAYQLFHVIEFVDVSLGYFLDLLVFITFVDELYDAVGFAVFTEDCSDYEVLYLRRGRLVVDLAYKVSLLISRVGPVQAPRGEHDA